MEVTVILKAMEASRQSRFSTGDHMQLHSFSTHTHKQCFLQLVSQISEDVYVLLPLYVYKTNFKNIFIKSFIPLLQMQSFVLR